MNAYDVVIVGAGPAGSVMAHFLAVAGKSVALLEMKQFPRTKYCGDAWCSPALDILDEMGVLKEIERDGKCRPVNRGGFVSPSGVECIGGPYGSTSKIRTYAIKRVVCDEYIAKKAEKSGASLKENWKVETATFDKNDDGGMWTVTSDDQQTVKGRILICADGSNSFLARKLGLIPDEAPTAFCSHQYVKGGTHNLEADGVMFYGKSLLPGYSAVFKHYNGDMYLGTYILPGGEASSKHIAPYEKGLVTEHPDIKKIFGRDYEDVQWEVKLKTAPIRIGGVPKSYGDHVLVIGDAAGLVDPMTGEGIHTAMISGKMAAKVVNDMFEEGDFSEEAGKVYHEMWKREFGFDFIASEYGAKLMYHFPIIIDALARMGAEQGQAFLDSFGEVMTGVKSKAEFIKPQFSIPIVIALIQEIWIQKVMKVPSRIPDIARQLLNQKTKNEPQKRVKAL